LKDDPVLFNELILDSPPLWSKQIEVCQSFLDHRITCVQAGNGVGKSYVARVLLLFALLCFPNSKVLSTAPSNQLLVDVLWSEVREAWNRCILNKQFFKTDIQANPQRLVLTDGWEAKGWSSDSTAKMSGRHRGDLIWIIDEASDVSSDVWKGIWSTNPSKMLVLGNPLHLNNDFHRLCTEENPQVNVITISSLDNPDIDMERSTRGMSDRTWLDGIRYTYGEGSPYWTVHVEGKFNIEDDWSLIPSEWIDLCNSPHPGRIGPVRLSVDLSKGVGGTSDNSVIMVWDDAGILDLEAANTWALETTAQLTVNYAMKWKVEPSKVTYDGTGLGLGFGNQLDALGLIGTRAYIGTSSLRSASAWEMRQRLDPGRKIIPVQDTRSRPVHSLNHLFTGSAAPTIEKPYNQAPFSIGKKEWLDKLRPEFMAFRYKLNGSGGITLETKEELKKRLGHSCDFADALLIGCSNP
jgi:hypothetical protein